MNILPTITTTSHNWRDKVGEIEKLKLREISIFPTCLNFQERQELYQLVEKAGVKKIPFIHLRSDMAPEELAFLMKKFGTEVFNTHTAKEHPFQYDYGKYKDIIYIENVYRPLDEEEVKEFAGVCLDIAHLETDRILNPAQYEHNIGIIEKYGCGCNHISVIKKQPRRDEENVLRYDAHYLEDLSELDYLKKYPSKYFSPFIAMEMKNTIAEQLKAIDYIKSL